MTTSQAPKTPTQVVTRYLEAFFSRDTDRTLECLAEDVSWHFQGVPDVPTNGDLQGREQVRQWLESFPTHFEPIASQVVKTFEKGDHVILVGHFTHRITDTGKYFSSRFAAVCTVSECKIGDYDFIEDSFGPWNAFRPS